MYWRHRFSTIIMVRLWRDSVTVIHSLLCNIVEVKKKGNGGEGVAVVYALMV